MPGLRMDTLSVRLVLQVALGSFRRELAPFSQTFDVFETCAHGAHGCGMCAVPRAFTESDCSMAVAWASVP